MSKLRFHDDDDDYEDNEGDGKILGMKPLTLGLIGAAALVAFLVWKRRRAQADIDRSNAALNQSPAAVNAKNAARNAENAARDAVNAAAAAGAAAAAAAAGIPAIGVSGLKDRRGPSNVHPDGFDDGMGGRLREFGSEN